MVDVVIDAAVPVGGHLDAVAVAERPTLAQGVRGDVLDQPVIDLGPLELVSRRCAIVRGRGVRRQ